MIVAILTVSYQSGALNKQVTYRAIIPETKRRGEGKTIPSLELYPTLYLLHGYTGDQNDWLEYSLIREFAERYEIAVIMPAGENSFYFDPPIGPRYSTFIGKELVEKTRALFPLSHKREETLLAGFSMGGYGALLNGILHADTFGFVGSFSGVVLSASPDVNEGVIKIPIPILQMLVESGEWKDLPPRLDLLHLLEDTENRKKLPELFLSVGTEDYLYRENNYLHTYLEKENLSHYYFEGPGEHDWLFWNQVLPKFLNWYETSKS